MNQCVAVFNCRKVLVSHLKVAEVLAKMLGHWLHVQRMHQAYQAHDLPVLMENSPSQLVRGWVQRSFLSFFGGFVSFGSKLETQGGS